MGDEPLFTQRLHVAAGGVTIDAKSVQRRGDHLCGRAESAQRMLGRCVMFGCQASNIGAAPSGDKRRMNDDDDEDVEVDAAAAAA